MPRYYRWTRWVRLSLLQKRKGGYWALVTELVQLFEQVLKDARPDRLLLQSVPEQMRCFTRIEALGYAQSVLGAQLLVQS